MERLMMFDEAMEYLRLKKSTLYRLVQTGQIPASKVGRQWRFEKGELKKWLKSQMVSYDKRREEEARQKGALI